MTAYLYIAAELQAFFISCYYYKYLKKSFMKWFLPFLAFILIGEIISIYSGHYLKKSVVTVNYIIGIVESVFYGFIFRKLTQNLLLKNVIGYFVGVSILAYVVSFLSNSHSVFLLVANISTSGFLLSAISLTYLYFELKKEKRQNLLSQSGFWLVVGICFFYSGIGISMALYEISDFDNRNIALWITWIMCIVLYFSISISIVVFSIQKKKSLRLV